MISLITTAGRPVLWLACAIALLSPPQSAAASQSVEQFAEDFKAAYEAGDVAALEKMLYLEGTPDMTQSFRKEGVKPQDGTKIVSMKVVAPEPADSEPEVLNGNTYVPNITVINRIEVELGQSGGSYTQFFVVGKTPAGELAIGGIKLAGEAIAWTAPADAPKPETPEAFIEAYKAAYNAGDGATVAKMYYFKDTPDDFADFMLAFAEPWGSIDTIALSEHEDDNRPINGRNYVPNLTDLKRVEFKGEQSSGKFSIGKTPEGYYAIAGIRLAE